METIWKGKQANKTSNMCTSDKGKQTNKQVEAAHVEARMQGVVQSCITCGVRYAVCQSTWKSFRDASEMCQKSVEFNTQGHTLTLEPSWELNANWQVQITNFLTKGLYLTLESHRMLSLETSETTGMQQQKKGEFLIASNLDNVHTNSPARI